MGIPDAPDGSRAHSRIALMMARKFRDMKKKIFSSAFGLFFFFSTLLCSVNSFATQPCADFG
jgi:hypothetical protein